MQYLYSKTYHYPLAQFTLQHLAHFTPLLPFHD